MNCPYCGKLMQMGYLQSSRRFIWSPEKKEDIFVASKKTDIAFRGSVWEGCYAESWYCIECKKLVTEVNTAE